MTEQDSASQNALAANTDSATVTEEQVVPAVNETESAPVTETQATQNTEVEGSEPKVVKELIAQRKRRQQAEMDAAYWKGVAEARTDRTAPVQQPVATVEKAPVLDDFETYEEWQQADRNFVIKSSVAQAKKELARELQQQSSAKQQTAVFDKFMDKVELASEEYPDIKYILSDNTFPAPAHVSSIIHQSDQAIELILHLNNNRKEAIKIAQMNPIEAARALGFLEAQLKNKPQVSPPRTVSQAPAPIPTVTPSGVAVVEDANLPIDDFIARRNKAQYGR
jgi:hypothetical protein